MGIPLREIVAKDRAWRRRAKARKDCEKILVALKNNSLGIIKISELSGVPRDSVLDRLHELEADGLVEHVGRAWRPSQKGRIQKGDI